MKVVLKKKCNHPSCKRLAVDESSRCEDHTIKSSRVWGSNENDHFYNGKAWRQLRKRKISLSPLCERCKAYGVITAGAIVDHIKELKDGGSKLDISNLQTLCHACHNTKTADSKRVRKIGLEIG